MGEHVVGVRLFSIFWILGFKIKGLIGSFPKFLFVFVEDLNLMTMENIKEIKRERNDGWGFYVIRLCEPTSTRCSQWITSLLIFFLYDILDDYNVL